jgi:hypothetical protein
VRLEERRCFGAETCSYGKYCRYESDFNDFIPEVILQTIIGLVPPTPSESGGDDLLAWIGTSDGLFSTNSAYAASNTYSPHPNQQTFNSGPERIKLF